tara:strand:- start:543 stop:1235 length:693 start_codon:yes stop_codon:yes gene_type:complete
MISWLKGLKIDSWNESSKTKIIIACGGVGYEIQVLARQEPQLLIGEEITMWIHQVYREDGISMFGFQERSERDLFRKIILISGIGPQIAISLLEKYNYKDLIISIATENITKLTKVNGIGKRIAERLSIELRGKLTTFNEVNHIKKMMLDDKKKNSNLNDFYREEVFLILKNLDYKESEINNALNAVLEEIDTSNKQEILSPGPKREYPIDEFLRKALVWLSQEVSTNGT